MRVLTKKDILSILTNLTLSELQHFLTSLHDVLKQYSQSQHQSKQDSTIQQPEREVFTTKAGHTSLFMPASLTTVTAIKIVTLAKDSTNPVGAINVFEPTGELAGVLDAADITAFRTALAVMILYSKFDLGEGAKQNIVVFGAGKQAEWHVRLALQLQKGKVGSVTIVNRRVRENVQELIEELKGQYPDVEFRLVVKNDETGNGEEFQKFLRESDVIFGCTPSTVPLFTFADLCGQEKTRFIGLIGSYKPNMQEIDKETLLSGVDGLIYVDAKDACLKEAGEIIMGEVPEKHLVEVGEASSDLRLEKGKNVIFKCVGLGIMDVIVSSVLLEMATSKGVGTVVNM